jgi:tol-pal system protein YbgF
MNMERETGQHLIFPLSKQAIFGRGLFPVLLFSVFILTGCVTTEEAANTKSNLGQLQVQVANHDRDITQIKEQTSTITAIKENQTTILSQTSDLTKDIQALRGRFDENKYFQDKTLKDLMSELELLKARVVSLENQLKEVKTKPAAEPKDSGKPVESSDKAPADNDGQTVKGTDSAAKLYDEAHIALKERKYSDARKLFERFIKEYPKESLASNSYFWIAETYYSEKKFEDAILAYEDFLKKYPKHSKASGAMLKQGYAFIELGGSKNKAAGKDILEDLVEKYPKTKDAALAQKKIKEISKSAPAPKPQKSKKKK